MIGKVTKGASFYHCLAYCLEDKRKLSEEEKQPLSLEEGLQHKDRSEILEYNLCYGDKYELAQQFRDVEKLSRRVEKPVLHLSIRSAPGDQLTSDQWREIGRAAAHEFGVADHQYICVLHKDTKQPHIHVVANRVGYDGRVASDSNSYARMANFCRRIEKEYHLKIVLSPRRFLPAKERHLPRMDQRKDQLKEDIVQALRGTRTYAEFEKKMQSKGYRVDKGRGIAFEDNKKVRVKGSEVDYSWQAIERILAQNERAVLLHSQNEKKAHPEGGQSGEKPTPTAGEHGQESPENWPPQHAITTDDNTLAAEVIKKLFQQEKQLENTNNFGEQEEKHLRRRQR